MPAKSATRPQLQPRIKFWLELDGENVFCRRFAELLAAVDRTHSIKAAAAEVGRSYRHVWSRIKKTEQSLGQTLVETQIGGKGPQRSELTPLARELLHDYLELRAEMTQRISSAAKDRLQAILARHRSKS